MIPHGVTMDNPSLCGKDESSADKIAMTHNEADVLSVEQDMEKTIKVFCWDAVNRIVARAFLRAAYLAERQSDQATGVAKLDDAKISVICDDLFGRPPKKKFLESKRRVGPIQWA